MNKVLQSTSRGQITLPKAWRDNFDTNYYKADMDGDRLVITPIYTSNNFKDSVAEAWQEYDSGEKMVTHEELMDKYGL